MSVVVVRGGLQTTIQDLGRRGNARNGVPEGGALDPVALRVANMLVGNSRDAAGLELTIEGPHLLFERAESIAICGADMPAVCGDVPLPQWRAIDIDAGSTVCFASTTRGARTYVAFAGGIEVPIVLGGRGTYLVGCFGGLEGRQLRRGDRIEIASTTHGDKPAPTPALGMHSGERSSTASSITGSSDDSFHAASWTVDPAIHRATDNDAIVRVIGLPSFNEFIPRLLDHSFTVSPVSDRMGLRLNESITVHDESIVSEPTLAGAIQLPPDGCPMILLNDHQTAGGYPIIAYVATVDLPVLGQLRPGATLRFIAIDVDRARRLLAAREHDLRQLQIAIALRQMR